MKDKLESDVVRTWLYEHDIVVLSETKTTATPSVPGFVAINNSKHRHGGIAILIRRWLFSHVRHIDINDEGVVWFELSNVPGVLFCGMYNEPSDSPYFRHGTFASIPAHLSEGKDTVIIGDLNARIGNKVSSLVENSRFSYNVIDEKDNANGRALLRLSSANDLLVVNNLRNGDKMWESNFTYRQSRNWVSEVDICLVSRSLADAVSKFSVNQSLSFPSDHAPVSVTFDFSRCESDSKLTKLTERSNYLGSYDSLAVKPSAYSKPIPYKRIDNDLFTQNIEQHDVSEILDGSDVHATVENFSKLIYNCAENSKSQPASPLYSNDAKVEDRWQRIMEANDSRSLWLGIDWNGKYRETRATERPPEEAFQCHMERLLNPADIESIDPNLANNTGITIPLLDDPFEPVELLHVVDKQMKPDKGCGPDGNSPGILKVLPISILKVLIAYHEHYLPFRCLPRWVGCVQTDYVV